MIAHFPARDLWWLAVGGLGYGARFLQLRARAARVIPPDATGNLLRLQTLYGYNAHSLVSVAPGARVWTTPEIDGAVVYNESGRVRLATGDPLAEKAEASHLARQFILAAQQSGRIAAFVPTTARFAESMTGVDLTIVKIRAAPYFDLKSWEPRGDRAKRVRRCSPLRLTSGGRPSSRAAPSTSQTTSSSSASAAWSCPRGTKTRPRRPGSSARGRTGMDTHPRAFGQSERSRG
jgi:lysylphosphatidylglycerol synthetase-like protein (DUF2156 family)